MERPIEEESAWLGRPVWADIDLDALEHNVRELKRQACGALLMAIVKANAYGHGATGIARAALAAGADRLGVVCVDEGEELRRAGITAPILVMGHTPVSQAERAVALDLTTTVGSHHFAEAVAQRAIERGVTIRVHLKVETGLNRYGLPPEQLLPLAESMRHLPGLDVEGLWTHFATGDEPDKGYVQRQFRAFTAVADQLPWIRLRHVANTATVLDMPELSLDMVRVGIGLYGCYPSEDVDRGTLLRPVMSLKSRVARLRRLDPGESVSYGCTWTAARPSVVALLMCGYGDGLRRTLSNKGSVLVRGRRAPIVGRIAMDMCVADATDIPYVALDDEVVIIGRQRDDEISAEEVARLSDTISYETLTGITARVPRVYRRGGRITAVQTLVEAPAEESATAGLESRPTNL
ncbi:MAG: alanine racemase [Dehalococcoidia bacterium]|nr:alanine racemase [Dehalococcoidia bacterium]